MADGGYGTACSDGRCSIRLLHVRNFNPNGERQVS